MAQFNHPEFSGSGQWMRGGMTMVSDMFNNYLKGRVDGLCTELSNLVASQPDLVRSGSFQSQSQGSGYNSGQAANSYGGGGQQQGSGDFGQASLFVPRHARTTGGRPTCAFRTAPARRTACATPTSRRRGAWPSKSTARVTVYDTLDHQIGGFWQQQSYGGSLSFNSQYGLIDVAACR